MGQASFDDRQAEAVETFDGQWLVISGAGSGKCVKGDSLVLSNSGLKRIDRFGMESCELGSAMPILDLEKRCFRSGKSSHWYKLDKSSVIRIETKSGFSITGTYEHPILVLNENGDLEFRRLDRIRTGDVAALAFNTQVFGENGVGKDMAYLMGLLLGDGWSREGTIGFSKWDIRVEVMFRRLIRKLFGYTNVKSYYRKDDSDRHSVTHYVCSVEIKKKLEELGLYLDCGALNKVVPHSILSAVKEDQVAFLQGLFDTDAGVYGCTFEFSTASSELAKQVQLMLMNMGVRTVFIEKMVKGVMYFLLQCTGNALRRFSDQIGFREAIQKQERLEKAINRPANTNVDVLYHQRDRFRRMRKDFVGKSWWDGHNNKVIEPSMTLHDYFKGKRNPSRQRCLDVGKLLPDNKDARYLIDLATNFWFDPIKRIIPIAKKLDVYDFTIPDTHSFIANGFVNHNTRVLTHRVGKLIQKGVKPSEMLVFTFTNDAANEMKMRLMAIVGDHVQTLNVGTIHSQLNRILRESIAMWKPNMRNYQIMDSWGQLKFVKDCFKELRIEANNYQNPKIAIQKIGMIKNNCMTIHDYVQFLEEQGLDRWKEDWFIDFYSYYERMREMNRMIGFDDMLSETYWMFKSKPQILEIYKNKFRFILMDEFQDTNKVQLEVSLMLQSKHQNFFAVGDPRQCQPAGTMVLVSGGEWKPIEELEIGDYVVSYSRSEKAFVGQMLPTNKVLDKSVRFYSGPLATVSAGGKSTRCTPIHKWLVRWKNGTPEFVIQTGEIIPELMKICVYDGSREGGWYPVQIYYEMVQDLPVHSLKVEKDETYVADGLMTQNSIYAFRGAVPEYAVYFTKYFTEGKVIELEFNYRCPHNIIELGNDLMDQAKWKFSRIKAFRKEDGHIQFYESFLDGDEEADAAVEEIVSLSKTVDIEYKDIAILYRTNAQSRPLEEALIRRAIPYKVEQSFYNSAEIKDMVSFIKYMSDDTDMTALERVVNKPNRYLGQSFIGQLKDKAKSMSLIEALKSGTYSHNYMNTNARDFASQIEYIRSLELDTVGGYMNVVRERLKYDDWIADSHEESVAVEKVEKLNELSTLANHFKTIKEFLEYLAKLDGSASGDANAVELKTIHRSKGLEFKVIFVIGVSEKILPHSRASDVEEERRLLYVAITRAIERVYLSHVLTRFNQETEPSRFLAELGFDAGYDDLTQDVADGNVATVNEAFRKEVIKEIREIQNDIQL